MRRASVGPTTAWTPQGGAAARVSKAEGCMQYRCTHVCDAADWLHVARAYFHASSPLGLCGAT
jgi:hypothetical protein